jgi:hypothetical protein
MQLHLVADSCTICSSRTRRPVQTLLVASSYFATDGRSVSQSVSQSVLALSPSGTRDQILAVVKTVAVLSWGVLPDDRTGLSCNRSQSLSVLAIHTYVHFVFCTTVVSVFVSCLLDAPQNKKTAPDIEIHWYLLFSKHFRHVKASGA